MEDTFYMPLTAAPFRKNEAYKEVLPKNAELAKYIRCFWGSPGFGGWIICCEASCWKRVG